MPAKKGRTWSHELGVIGLKFRWTRDGRIAIQHMLDKASMPGIRLVREPDNKYDENAIMVLLPTRVIGGKQLGYLHREAAALLAPKIDAGTLEVSGCTLYSLDPDQDYNVGEMVVRFRDLPAKVTGINKKTAKRKTAKSS